MYSKNLIQSAQRRFIDQGSALRCILSNRSFSSMSMQRPRATNIVVQNNDDESCKLTVEWSDGARSSYPSIYLRDNSWDSKTANGQRLFETFELQPTQLGISKFETVRVDAESEILKIKWSDDAESTFSVDWLFDNSCSDKHRSQRNRASVERVTLWDRQTLASPRTICSYREVEKHRIAIYKELREYGVCLVEGCPVEETYDEHGDPPVTVVGNILGHVRETNYGRHFDVRVEPRERDSGHLAYTTKGLSVHTDNPYRVPTPGVQLLHCLKQAPPSNNGNDGMSVLIDGFKVANVLKQRYPAEFELLSSIKRPFTYYDLTGGYKFHKERYVIGVDGNGNIESVHYNNRSASSHQWDIAEEQIEPYYAAWRLFGSLLDDPDRQYAMDYRLEPGQLVIFDNNRVLHGRRGYSLSVEEGGNQVDQARHLQGCYIDFDSVWGRLDGYEYQQRTNGVNGM